MLGIARSILNIEYATDSEKPVYLKINSRAIQIVTVVMQSARLADITVFCEISSAPAQQTKVIRQKRSTKTGPPQA